MKVLADLINIHVRSEHAWFEGVLLKLILMRRVSRNETWSLGRKLKISTLYLLFMVERRWYLMAGLVMVTHPGVVHNP